MFPGAVQEQTEKVRTSFSKFIDYLVALLQIAKDEEISADIEKFEHEIRKAEDELSQLLKQVDMTQKYYFDTHEHIEEARESLRGRKTPERGHSQSPGSNLMIRSRGSGRGEIETRIRSLSRSSSIRSRVADETRINGRSI